MQLNDSAGRLGICRTAKEIFRNEGVLGFWKGNIHGVALYATYNAVQFSLFERLRGTNSFIGGSLSGAVATVLTYPLDVLRTRFSVKSRATQSAYKNPIYAFKAIAQQEGVFGLYRGLAPTLLSIVPANGISFWAFHSCKEAFSRRGNDSPLYIALSGAIAGAASKAATMPLDVIRKRLQLQCPLRDKFISYCKPYAGVAGMCKEILKTEGITGFYKGLSAALVKSAPSTAISFATYWWLSSKKN